MLLLVDRRMLKGTLWLIQLVLDVDEVRVINMLPADATPRLGSPMLTAERAELTRASMFHQIISDLRNQRLRLICCQRTERHGKSARTNQASSQGHNRRQQLTI
jgi:hypothetical protein